MPGAPEKDWPIRAVVSLGALRANFEEARRLAAGREVIGVVKADAYGHGAVPVARALEAAGCPRLAVQTLDEGCELREAGIELPILVLGGAVQAPRRAVEARLTPVLHHRGMLDALARVARGADLPLPVQVEVDTGMRRMGIPPEEAVGLLEAVAAEPGLVLEGVYTHFARADEPDLGHCLEQIVRFREVLAALRARGIDPPLVHTSNSAALMAGKPLFEALPEANAVRPGLMLYGPRPAPHLEGRLEPVMTLRTRVAHVRRVRPGEPVGYDGAWTAERETRVATLAVGYADGLPISASNRGEVWVAGRRCPLVGRVSMDFVGVDVGALEVAPGDEAVLFGAGGAPLVEELAEAADTIAYELLVRVGRRALRVYED